MEHLEMKTPDGAQLRLDELYKICPSCFTEMEDKNGKLTEKVDFDKLREFLGDYAIENAPERYDFTWVGKHAALREAAAPINKTLRPCPEESVDWDKTQNLYIEGDNLEVLKLLQNSYMGKVKMIYIDPPYNTGQDFVYHDDFSESAEEYVAHKRNEFGKMYFKNTDSNGKFHSDWCSMMYSRLLVARSLLKEDGVIFISMDDHELGNLKSICSEIFGENNFEGIVHWRRRHNQPNDPTKMIGIVAEHILCFAKNSAYLKFAGVGKIDVTASFTNPDNDPRGPWASKPWKVGSDQSGCRYEIIAPNGNVLNEDWMGEEKTYKELLADKRIIFPRGGDGMPRKKYFKFERESEGQCATNWWPHELFGHNQGANDCITQLFGVKNVFSNPKPIELMRGFIQVGNVKSDDIVLDFFSGSSSMAHAVMKYNEEFDKSVKYIMVQLQEDLDESVKHADSKSKKQIEGSIKFLDSINKKHFITEIGKERIRRVGAILGKNNPKLDIGFRVFKCDSSNMNDVYFAPKEYDQQMLLNLVDNIREGRFDLDLLFDCMLRWGVELSLPMTKTKVGGCTIHNVNDGDLVACFDGTITEQVIDAIAEMSPLRVVFRDSSFTEASQKMNLFELFKQKCNWDDTEVKNNVKVI